MIGHKLLYQQSYTLDRERQTGFDRAGRMSCECHLIEAELARLELAFAVDVVDTMENQQYSPCLSSSFLELFTSVCYKKVSEI